MADFKRERVLFHVVGQGTCEVEYEVGAETPEQAFRRLYDTRPRGIRLRELLHNADDFDHVLTVAIEPTPEPDVNEDDWESRVNWTNRSDAELVHHLNSDHGVYNIAQNRTELNLLHDQAHRMANEREEREMERAREDEADQFRTHR